MKPSAPGELTLTAQSGDTKATHKITVKPSVPRPVVFWDFSNPPITDKEMFVSDFGLKEDLTQRANRAVARVDLSVKSAVGDNGNGLLKVNRLPEADKLNKGNIRGVVVDAMTSADFQCDDPGANVMVIMQSPANWWMRIGYDSAQRCQGVEDLPVGGERRGVLQGHAFGPEHHLRPAGEQASEGLHLLRPHRLHGAIATTDVAVGGRKR